MTIFQKIEQLDLSDYIRPGNAVIIGQGLAEPCSITEVLVAQRKQLGVLNLFIGPVFFQYVHAGKCGSLQIEELLWNRQQPEACCRQYAGHNSLSLF